MLTPTLTRYVSQKTALSSGLVLAAFGSGILALVPNEAGTATTVVAITVLAIGTGPLFALGIGYVVSSVPPERAGAAASLADTSNYLGGALGLALLGTVATASYRSQMSDVVGSAESWARPGRREPAGRRRHPSPADRARSVHQQRSRRRSPRRGAVRNLRPRHHPDHPR